MNFHWYHENRAMILEYDPVIIIKGHIHKSEEGSWILSMQPFMNNHGAIVFQKMKTFTSKTDALEWFEDNIT